MTKNTFKKNKGQKCNKTLNISKSVFCKQVLDFHMPFKILCLTSKLGTKFCLSLVPNAQCKITKIVGKKLWNLPYVGVQVQAGDEQGGVRGTGPAGCHHGKRCHTFQNNAKYANRKLFALLLNVFSAFCKLLACPLSSVGDPDLHDPHVPDPDPLGRGTDPAPDPSLFS